VAWNSATSVAAAGGIARLHEQRVRFLPGGHLRECVAYLLPFAPCMVDQLGCREAGTVVRSAGEASQGARFATQLEAVWFAAHLPDQEPRVAHIAGEWVVMVLGETAWEARGLPADSDA
jgi:hypothetical protein